MNLNLNYLGQRTRLTRCSHQRRGYVLLMTVMILAITSCLLVSLATLSLSNAVQAKTHSRDVSRKWSHASCQRFGLAYAASILNQQNQSNLSFTVNLGDVKYFISLADESAKLNLNDCLQQMSRDQVGSLVRSQAPRLPGLTVRLRPTSASQTTALNRPLECWGQVFEPLDDPLPLSAADWLTLTQRVTLWGQGVNVRTASEDTIFLAAKIATGPAKASKLVESLKETPTPSLREAVDSASPTSEQRQALNKMLFSRSTAYSVAVISNAHDYRKESLSVREFYTDTISRTHTFSW